MKWKIHQRDSRADLNWQKKKKKALWAWSKSIETIQPKEWTNKKNEDEQNLWDLWNTIKHTNLNIMGVPEARRKKWAERQFEETTEITFPNVIQTQIHPYILEAQGIPHRINWKKSINISNCWKTKIKSLKHQKQNNSSIQGIFKINSWLFIRTHRGQMAIQWYFQSTEDCQSRILYLAKLSFRNEGFFFFLPPR